MAINVYDQDGEKIKVAGLGGQGDRGPAGPLSEKLSNLKGEANMSRYQLWDKVSDIYTPGRGPDGKSHFTAEEWKDMYPWITAPGAKMMITAGIINGGCAMEWESTKAQYKRMGAAITDGMSDEEALAAIEEFEDNPPRSDEPTVEERTAAALEFLALMSLPDEA